MEKVDGVREEALKIIIKVFEEKSFSNILIKNLKQEFSPLDRAFITEIVYGTIKWRLRIDNAVDSLSRIKTSKLQAPILNILRMGIYQLDFMDKVPESAAVNECVKLARKYGNPGSVKFVNGVLRNYIRNRNNIPFPSRSTDVVKYLSLYYSFPEWMVSRLIEELGEEFTEDFLKHSNDIPPLTVRVNKLKISKTDLMEALSQKGIQVLSGRYVEDALILKNTRGIENLEEYKKGYLTVQDESSMLAALVLNPKAGDIIMDVCSAPGTKSTYIGELMGNKGTVLAGDINQEKLKLVKQNAVRLGIDIINTYCQDATCVIDEYKGKADRVLVDAPCSGLGILRKKPEIRWNRNIKDVAEIRKVQEAILNTSASYVKKGGVLVYSTCTVLKEENINLVNRFVENNKSFVFEDITNVIPEKLRRPDCLKGYIELYPNVEGIDGFFIARLRRVN